MITRRGGKGPAAKHFNVCCDACQMPTPLFNHEQFTPGVARQALEKQGWVYDKPNKKDYCPRHAILARSDALLVSGPTVSSNINRVYSFGEE